MLLGSSIIELALGMIFFYFLLSTLCAHVNELIAGLMDWRAQELVKGIRDLLNAQIATGTAKQVAATPPQPALPEDLNDLGDRLLSHNHIKGLATRPGMTKRFFGRKQHLPSYIPASTFATALTDILLTATLRRDHSGRMVHDYEHKLQTASTQAEQLSAETLRDLSQMQAELPGATQQAFRSLIDQAFQQIEAVRAEIAVEKQADLPVRQAVQQLRNQVGDLGYFRRWTIPSFVTEIASQLEQTNIADLEIADTRAALTPDQIVSKLREAVIRLPEGPREALLPLVDKAADKPHVVHANIEAWFNAKMDRVKGSYKRWTQLTLFLLGFAVAIPLNADSITVARVVWQTPTLRQSIANQAQEVAASPPASPPASPDPYERTSEQVKQVQQDVQNVLIFPIGWGADCNIDSAGTALKLDAAGRPIPNLPNCWPRDGWGWFYKIMGLIATTLAISLGAPFWFDLLRKVSNLRSSGPAPNEKDSATAAERTAGA